MFRLVCGLCVATPERRLFGARNVCHMVGEERQEGYGDGSGGGGGKEEKTKKEEGLGV